MGYRRWNLIMLALIGAGVILYLLKLPSSARVADAAPAAPQMMGGGMGNRAGMQGMMRRVIQDNVPPGVKPQDLPAPQSKGAKLTVRYCTQCHNLASPAMHSAKEWKAVVSRMIAQMRAASGSGMMARSISAPSTGDQKEILAYLQTHALKPISPDALSSPHSPGALAFRRSCSECHALPNPRLHSANDWPAVVRKMQSYSKQMSKRAITNQQAEEIESYLASQARR